MKHILILTICVPSLRTFCHSQLDQESRNISLSLKLNSSLFPFAIFFPFSFYHILFISSFSIIISLFFLLSFQLDWESRNIIEILQQILSLIAQTNHSLFPLSCYILLLLFVIFVFLFVVPNLIGNPETSVYI